MRKVSTKRKQRINVTMDKLATSMLERAQALFEESSGLDTAVRDIVAEGLARIVHAAYDTRGCAQCVSDFDFAPYIETKTYEWFRERGFVEWFCVGASTLFKTSPRSFFRVLAKQAKSGKAMILTHEKVS